MIKKNTDYCDSLVCKHPPHHRCKWVCRKTPDWRTVEEGSSPGAGHLRSSQGLLRRCHSSWSPLAILS